MDRKDQQQWRGLRASPGPSHFVETANGGALDLVGIPLVIEKVGGDPAVISGVFVTTVTDCVGFFAVLGLATWWYGIV